MQEISTKGYKTRHDWVGKMIHREMSKKLKFDQTNKWYMHNPPSVSRMTHINSYGTLTYKLIPYEGDPFVCQRGPDFSKINKKKRTCKIVDFALSADHRIKLRDCEKKDEFIALARELKNLWNMKMTIILIVIGAFSTSHQRIIKGTERLGNRRKSGDYPNYYIIENGQNTEKSPGD